MSLLSRTIELAKANPDVRHHLLPILRRYAGGMRDIRLPKGFVLPEDPKITFKDEKTPGGGYLIKAMIGKVMIGFLGVSKTPNQYYPVPPNQIINEFIPQYRKAYLEATKAVGKHLNFMFPGYTEIVPEMRGKGLGVELYVRAAKLAAADDCLFVAADITQNGGPTSPDAGKVWDSSKFNGRVRVFANGMVWGG